MEGYMTSRFSITLALACIAALTGALALVGCKQTKQGAEPETPSGPAATASVFEQPRKPEGSLRVRLITNGISPFWDAMGRGVDDVKGELKVDATWLAPQQPDNNAQKRAFEDAIAAGVDGIAVSAIQADAFAPVIDGAIEKGIPVITFDSDSEKSRRLVYIGTNNYEAGRRAGEAAMKLMPDGGNLVAFVGNMSAQNARDRYRGFTDAIKGSKLTMLQDPYEDDKDAVGRAHRNVGDAITKYGAKLNGLLGLYSYNGPAIVDEVQKAGLMGKVRILCFDGEPKTLTNLGAGLVDATVVQKPYEFGRLSTKLLTLINRKGLKAALEEMDGELKSLGMTRDANNIDTGVEVVTKQSAADFLKALKAKGLKST
jgi:ribose transport system substrate-binding protein